MKKCDISIGARSETVLLNYVHDIEPYYHWITDYQASEDEQSPFYGKSYDEFKYHNKVYNYFIHPQWDEFGSSTLYTKILFADYDESFAILEFIGEWNDCIHNDVMHLKRNVIDDLIEKGVTKYVLIVENVMNFHSDDDDYYAEWYEEIIEQSGFICLVNPHPHVKTEMRQAYLDRYLQMSDGFDDFSWRKFKPHNLIHQVELKIQNKTQLL